MKTEWTTHAETCEGGFNVYSRRVKPFCTTTTEHHHVKRPNWLERGLGITLEWKFDKAMRKQHRITESLNYVLWQDLKNEYFLAEQGFK